LGTTKEKRRIQSPRAPNFCHPEQSEGPRCGQKYQDAARHSPGPPLKANVAMKDREYFVYIMSSRSGTLYIGMTNSIYRRAVQHKSGKLEGFASKYHCNRLVYYESFEDVHQAIGREKQLKGWLRIKKITLIESKNPRWEDFAEKWGAQMLFAGESMRNR
jgi:putative endonuclease